MKQTRLLMGSIFAFVYVLSLLMGYSAAQVISITVTTDEPIYPIWHVGGTIRITATNLDANTTYYLWLQKPGDSGTHIYGSGLSATGRTTLTIDLKVSQTDPAGTYLLSLSKSISVDTRESFAHFGVLGLSAKSYERTQEARIAGGGFVANSTITIDLRNNTMSLQNFPINITAQRNGEFVYAFKTLPRTQAGPVNITVSGVATDSGRTVSVSTPVEIRPTTISAQMTSGPPSAVERTSQINAIYLLSYADGTPVQDASPVAHIVSAQKVVADVPLVLLNSSKGLWKASWTPPVSADLSGYQFELAISNVTDIYGNTGKGAPIISSTFNVVRANFELSAIANQTVQRTQEATIMIVAKYHNGVVANVTQTSVDLTQSDGRHYPIPVTFNGTALISHLKIPVNASIGIWRLDFTLKDLYGNSGSGRIIFQVTRASLTFVVNYPNPAERTTFVNMTTIVTYPDGSQLASGVEIKISKGNQTWSPTVYFNSTTSQFEAQYYLPQNATIGTYNIILNALDGHGNMGNFTGFLDVAPARLRFLLPSNNATVDSLTTMDLSIIVRYPNSSSMTNNVGIVMGSYTNATGGSVDLPLVFNQTEGKWHLYFSVPEEGNVTFSFRASDHYSNEGSAIDAFNLKILASSRVTSQRLIIAGVIGALVPIGLLVWAIAAVSTRRRKHRP